MSVYTFDQFTIPPITWITCAHNFGVKCLGTFIIEHWATYDNSSGDDEIRDLLYDHNTVKAVCEQMVQLMHHYCFDGWLINMETPISREKISLMKHFLQVLTEMTHEATNGNGLIIWYDSVTADTGRLEWQNELNKRNESFYLACDGIFLNYCWNEAKLAHSKMQEINAGRRFDCYVGVDVFGRGCPGGGKWNTSKAVELACRHRLSVAIFAPGWTFESIPIEGRLTTFYWNEAKFWLKLLPYFHQKVLNKLPVSTNFCQGFGYHQWREGVRQYEGTWLDLKKQQLQPALPCLTKKELENFDLSKKMLPWRSVFDQPAWDGGCCLELLPPIMNIYNCLLRMSITACPGDTFELIVIYRFDVECCLSTNYLEPVLVYNQQQRLHLSDKEKIEKEKVSEDMQKQRQHPNFWTIVKYLFSIKLEPKQRPHDEETLELNELGFVLRGQQTSVLLGFVSLDKTEATEALCKENCQP